MNRPGRRPLIAALILAAGGLGATAAKAHPDVQWSVTIGSPFPGRVVVPVPAPVVVVPPRHEHRALPPPARGFYRERSRWDIDGDGIPNRHDRVYNPRWDVDGDGIPNRRDAHPGYLDRYDRYYRYDHHDRYDRHDRHDHHDHHSRHDRHGRHGR